MRRLRLPFAALALTAVLAPSAHATTPTWLAKTPISDVGETLDSESPQIVLHADQGATALWVSVVGGQKQVRSAHRTPGGNWLPAEDVGAAYDVVELSERAITSAPNGDVTAVWQVNDGVNVLIVTATRDADSGEWGTQTLLSAGGTNNWYPTIRSDADSRMWVAWTQQEYDEGDDQYYNRVRIASRPAGSPTWTTMPFVSQAGIGSSYPMLEIAPNGDVAVAWTDNLVGESDLYVRVLDHTDDTWSTIENFLGQCDDPAPQDLRFTPDSTLVLAYASCEGGDLGLWRGKASMRPAGGSWSTPTTTSTSIVAGPRLAVTADGDVVTTWTGITPDPLYWVGSSDLPFGGAWSTENLLTTTPGVGYGGAPVALAGGSVLLPYVTGDDESNLLPRTQFWTAGSWQAGGLMETGLTGSMPVAAANTNGDAAVIWKSAAGRVIATIGDDSGPRLNSLFIATTAIAGFDTGFHLEPADDWSALGTTTWTFGDGDTDTGNDVNHTYDEAGTYTVTVAATDAIGKTSTLTQALTVTPQDVVTTTTTTSTTTTDAGSTTTDTPGGGGVPTTETPFTEPTPTTPTVLPPTPKPTAKAIEARLRGRKLTVAAAVNLKGGARCNGKASGTTKVGGKTYKLKLKLKTTKGACLASGSVTLKKAPAKKTKVTVKISGRGFTARTLTAAR